MVAAATAGPLDEAVRRLVTGPLGMSATGFRPNGPADRFAASERRADGTGWTGTVHDENARLMGGVAGHAGLFAPAADLARFAAWWVSDADGVVPAALRRSATPARPRPRRTPGLWLGLPRRPYDILGGHWPPTAVSTPVHRHQPGAGPADRVWAVLLTNAVHSGRDPAAIKALRRDVHAAVSARTA